MTVLTKKGDEIESRLAELERIEKEGKLNRQMKIEKKVIETALEERRKAQAIKPKTRKTKGYVISIYQIDTKLKHSFREKELDSLYPYPEKSMYFHPVTNPYGAPPPGRPMMYIHGFDPNNEEHIKEAKELSKIPPPPPEEDEEIPPPPPPEEEEEEKSTMGHPPMISGGIPPPMPGGMPPPIPMMPGGVPPPIPMMPGGMPPPIPMMPGGMPMQGRFPPIPMQGMPPMRPPSQHAPRHHSQEDHGERPSKVAKVKEIEETEEEMEIDKELIPASVLRRRQMK